MVNYVITQEFYVTFYG